MGKASYKDHFGQSPGGNAEGSALLALDSGQALSHHLCDFIPMLVGPQQERELYTFRVGV